MEKTVAFQYEADLEYQRDAINGVINLFEGLSSRQGDFEVSHSRTFGMGLVQTELGVGNQLPLSSEQILQNLQTVQLANNLERSNQLSFTGDDYPFPNFSVEMETGTGKTYVYLRTIFSLSERYGFKKFIIVVPSVAIREGVISAMGDMREHLSALYGHVPYDSFVYNSSDLARVAQFARSNEIQIMIINIQAFQKDAGDEEESGRLSDEQRKKLNVIHQEQDKMMGRRPIEYIQATRPILIIDEPQSVDNTVKSRRAIKTLSPLFALRYSATHINPYHLVYKLDPIRAYDLKLVKQIEVASIRADENVNDVLLRLESVEYPNGGKSPVAKLTVLDDKKGVTKPRTITLKQGTDVSDQTSHPGYDGYIVSNICAEAGLEHVEFTNGKTLALHQEEGGMSDEVMKSQIRQTIEEHFKKEYRFRGKGIKVLSLFFIDKVANYRWYDEERKQHKGKLAEWFEAAYRDISEKPKFKGLIDHPVEAVHDGYFAEDKKQGKTVALKEYKTDKDGEFRNIAADDEVFNLIMRKKNELLSLDVPLRFIFSHSALKEGWDNPNVFQICSLREMGTERQRRQTIGRGMRLPVDQQRKRIYDETINKLTVIASESFEEYAQGLQRDYERDLGIQFGKVPQLAFADIVPPKGEFKIGPELSEQIWNILGQNGMLANDGGITEKFCPGHPAFHLDLPQEFKGMEPEIIEVVKRYLFEGRIKNSRQTRTVKYNKRVELNPEFHVLWQKICHKTRYSVVFKTEELINRAVSRIKDIEKIQPMRISIAKTELDIGEAGVMGGRELDTRIEEVHAERDLPDILAFLQWETELTRSTLLEILVKVDRWTEFSCNPQVFMTEMAKQINRALSDLVIDGIKYERIDGQLYEMRLFEEHDELTQYLDNLYEIQSQDDRCPYNYVAWESEVERDIAEKLDGNEQVKFFCKLPDWFKIKTPLGDYNPDWAVAFHRDQKLYLVRESKSTHDAYKRRSSENDKIKCGKAHFDALGVNFKVATNISEVLSE